MAAKPSPRGNATMPEDLYTAWLGIPAGARPPDPYALLGLPPSCSDLAAIEEAAVRQFERLDRRALHPDAAHREACQRVMNEVARARMVLASNLRRRADDGSVPADGIAPKLDPPLSRGAAGIFRVPPMPASPAPAAQVAIPPDVASGTVEPLREVAPVRRNIRRARTWKYVLAAGFFIVVAAISVRSVIRLRPDASKELTPVTARDHAVARPDRVTSSVPAEWTAVEYKLSGSGNFDTGTGAQYPYSVSITAGKVVVLDMRSGVSNFLDPPNHGTPIDSQIAGMTAGFRSGETLFLYDVAKSVISELPGKCNGPYGLGHDTVAYVEDRDLYLYQRRTKTRKRITTSGNPVSSILLTPKKVIWISGEVVFAYDIALDTTAAISETGTRTQFVDVVDDVVVWQTKDATSGRMGDAFYRRFSEPEIRTLPLGNSSITSKPFTDGERIVWTAMHSDTSNFGVWLLDLRSRSAVRIYTSKAPVLLSTISRELVAFDEQESGGTRLAVYYGGVVHPIPRVRTNFVIPVANGHTVVWATVQNDKQDWRASYFVVTPPGLEAD